MSKTWKVTAKRNHCSNKIPKGFEVEIIDRNKPGNDDIKKAYEQKLGSSLPNFNFLSEALIEEK